MEPAVSSSDSICDLKHYMPSGMRFSENGEFIICDVCQKNFNTHEDLRLMQAHLESCSHPAQLIVDYIMISMYIVGMEPEELLI